MDQRIPKHHLKQEICATRPAYREGRIPKAVKVYTINNESKYILIQGVPSVGAIKELVQLCSSYGEIDEHHALDEYPCKDKYTDVYLVKYKSIQSARFAKRKLDDYSFFGGNLHVCYAPEYESVTDTREKLQERRKVIASKIRNNKAECNKQKVTQPIIQRNNVSTSTTTELSEAIKKSHPPSSLSSSLQHIPNIDNVPTIGLHLSQQIHPEPSHSLSWGASGDDSLNALSPQPFTFVLPPPPKPSVNKNYEPKINYEYSRVPSKHSTLPVGFDGRIEQNKQNGSPQFTANAQSPRNAETNSSKEMLKIDKNYKPDKQALKFVPRQAVKRKFDDSKNLSSDEVDKDIRKKAFLLGDEQGPVDVPGRRNVSPEITPGASKSYNNTIKTIRGKISQVITDALMPKK